MWGHGRARVGCIEKGAGSRTVEGEERADRGDLGVLKACASKGGGSSSEGKSGRRCRGGWGGRPSLGGSWPTFLPLPASHDPFRPLYTRGRPLPPFGHVKALSI